MALPYRVHIWHLLSRILTWWFSPLSLICKPEMAIKDPFPFCNLLIVSKLYQWAELFCLLCFHLRFWCLNLKHFGSGADIWVSLIHRLCALGHFWLLLQHNHCTISIKLAEQLLRCVQDIHDQMCTWDQEGEWNITNGWCSCAVYMWHPYHGFLAPEIGFSRESDNYRKLYFIKGRFMRSWGWRPHS